MIVQLYTVVAGAGVVPKLIILSHNRIRIATHSRLHSHRQYGTTRSHTRAASHASKIVLVASTSPGLTVHDAKPPERPPYQQ